MNNIQFWIWVIIIAITFLARLRNKKGSADSRPQRRPQPPPPEETDRPGPLTFEELLKEIQAARQPEEKPVPVERAEPQPRMTLPNRPERSLERTDYSYQEQQKVNEVYEKARQEAFLRPSLEDTLKLEDTLVKFGQFRNYQPDLALSEAALLGREIRNPQQFKKAFIMSEILKRRF